MKTKLVLSICYTSNTLSQILGFINFILFISNVISLYIISELVAIIENQINDAFYILSKDLYLFITAIVQDFDILIQTLQKKINEIGLNIT